jgi:hypothetical protein
VSAQGELAVNLQNKCIEPEAGEVMIQDKPGYCTHVLALGMKGEFDAATTEVGLAVWMVCSIRFLIVFSSYSQILCLHSAVSGVARLASPSWPWPIWRAPSKLPRKCRMSLTFRSVRIASTSCFS